MPIHNRMADGPSLEVINKISKLIKTNKIDILKEQNKIISNKKRNIDKNKIKIYKNFKCIFFYNFNIRTK